MPQTLVHKLLADHIDGPLPAAGEEVELRIDQTLTQDATGTLVMLELEAMGAERARTQVSAQYVDHNLLQQDYRNADDHVFLRSACERFGLWFSEPGAGVSHPVHMQCFGRPGATLLGSDSHTCAAGSLAMFAVGAGGIEVASAIVGQPYHLQKPEVFGVELTEALPPWVSAKDVVLEMLRRHGVRGGVGYAIEYFGPGVANLSAMDRHVIANMGAELGATTTVFPSDQRTRDFLQEHGRDDAWIELAADEGSAYDRHDSIDLAELEPLIATPSSPGNVVPVVEAAGAPVAQAYIGSSANPGYRDFSVVAHIVGDRGLAPGVSLDINPTSRHVLERLSREGELAALIEAGARLHQTGCNGCIGMGQAPATGRNSLRTTPRNFPGRSGTTDDRVFLCSPETAAASAVTGAITDPRSLGLSDFEPKSRGRRVLSLAGPVKPPEPDRERPELIRGPNISPLPELEPPPDRLEVVVALRVGDDVSTDEILPGGTEVLPFRSNLPRIAEFCFRDLEPEYVARARDLESHAIVAGDNYGQGSSREHAALAPRFLGLRLVLARSYSRIHYRNLIAYGVVPLEIDDTSALERGATLTVDGLHAAIDEGGDVRVESDKGESVSARLTASPRQRRILAAGSLIQTLRDVAA